MTYNYEIITIVLNIKITKGKNENYKNFGDWTCFKVLITISSKTGMHFYLYNEK